MKDILTLLFANTTHILMGLFITLVMLYLFINHELPDYLQTLLISVVMFYIGNSAPTIFGRKTPNE